MKYEFWYKSILTTIANATAMKEAYDRLHAAGLSYEQAAYVYVEDYSKQASSGYSMGEVVTLCCGNVTLLRYDNTRSYAKSCKWRARHGSVVFRLTKTALREYARLCRVCYDAREVQQSRIAWANKAQSDDIRASKLAGAEDARKQALEAYTAIKALLLKHLDTAASDIKAGSRVFF